MEVMLVATQATRSRSFGARCGRLAVVFTAVVGLAAGCGGDGSSQLPTPEPEQPTAGTATVDPAHVPILAGFDAFVAAANRAANEADPDHPELAEHADGQALIETERDIERNADLGLRYVGEVVVTSAEVTELDMDVPPPMPNATLVACLDITDYVLVDESQSPVPVDRELERFSATAQLRHIPDGDRWIVVRLESDMDQPC